MAAGEGRRLRPLTERWAKPVLPIDGRPVVASLLRELSSAGFTSVTIVVGHLAAQVESLVGDGSAFGLAVGYAHQPEPLGSADAVARAIAAGAKPPLAVLAADTVWTPGDIRPACERWAASGASGGLAVREVPLDELPERSSVHVVDGRVAAVVEKPAPGEAASALAGAPLWLVSDDFAAELEHVPGPPYELAAAAQRLIDAGKTILALEVGPTRDITRPDDLVLRNFPYLSKEGW